MPAAKGGTDTGSIPPEMIAGALGACIGVYLVDYCQRVELPTEGLSLTAGYETSEKPSRISKMQVQVKLPPGIPERRLRALQKVAESCLVHNTLLQPPEIEVSIAQPGSG